MLNSLNDILSYSVLRTKKSFYEFIGDEMVKLIRAGLKCTFAVLGGWSMTQPRLLGRQSIQEMAKN
jgi:hypothetical protein